MTMIALFGMTESAAFETLLVSVPESIGVLLFGLGLMALAVFVRSILARGENDKTDDKAAKKA